MATISTNTAINFVLWTQSLAAFKTELAKQDSTIVASNIYFIAADKTIYLDGTYYGVTAEDLQKLQNDITANANNITSLVNIIAQPIKVKHLSGEGDEATYQYTTIGPALKYLDEELEAIKTLNGGSTVSSQIQSAIEELDADLRSHMTELGGVQSGYHVGVRVTEVDGKITGVQVVEDDIASATALSGTQGVVSGHQTALATLNGSDSTEGSVAKAVKDAKDALKGIQGTDTKEAETIAGAKAYADHVAGVQGAQAQAAAIAAAQAKIDELAGTDWTAEAGTVKAIIDELTAEGSTATEAMNTIADKLRDDFSYGAQGAQSTSVKAYIDGVVGAAQSSAQASAQAAREAAELAASNLIGALDGTQTDNYTAANDNQSAKPTTGHVGIQIVQEDGAVKSVDIVEDDIASAAALNTLSGTVGGHSTDISNLQNQLKWTVV